MHFPVSGVDCSPLLPPLIAFLVASLTASGGVSGAFLLLPFQMSVLGYVTPGVAPTNLIYNIVAIPGGVYRYLREGRMAWPLTCAVLLGSLPGMFVGAVIRLRYLPEPRAAKFFVGLVLLYLGGRLLYDWVRPSGKGGGCPALDWKFQQCVQKAGRAFSAGLPPDAVVKTRLISLGRIEYEFWNETFSFNPAAILALSLLVGLVGGIYGIGGGAIIAPFVVAIFHLPVYTVAGAALFGTFATSIAGVVFFELLATTALAGGATARPDWMLGALFGVGGLFGTYVGARLQKYVPERWIRWLLGLLVSGLAVGYVAQFFLR